MIHKEHYELLFIGDAKLKGEYTSVKISTSLIQVLFMQQTK